MTRYETELLPHAQVRRLIIDSGIKRVSNDAIKEFERVLVEYGSIISQEAMFIANENKRKTVKAKDIALAISNVIEII